MDPSSHLLQRLRYLDQLGQLAPPTPAPPASEPPDAAGTRPTPEEPLPEGSRVRVRRAPPAHTLPAPFVDATVVALRESTGELIVRLDRPAIYHSLVQADIPTYELPVAPQDVTVLWRAGS